MFKSDLKFITKDEANVDLHLKKVYSVHIETDQDIRDGFVALQRANEGRKLENEGTIGRTSHSTKRRKIGKEKKDGLIL